MFTSAPVHNTLAILRERTFADPIKHIKFTFLLSFHSNNDKNAKMLKKRKMFDN